MVTGVICQVFMLECVVGRLLVDTLFIARFPHIIPAGIKMASPARERALASEWFWNNIRFYALAAKQRNNVRC
jgi:hypothetical protein